MKQRFHVGDHVVLTRLVNIEPPHKTYRELLSFVGGDYYVVKVRNGEEEARYELESPNGATNPLGMPLSLYLWFDAELELFEQEPPDDPETIPDLSALFP